ncbi:MAG: MFS transporter, partial [Victivallaceae bacterium]|nr:MFS transporter [Victivallaceae bacterium]
METPREKRNEYSRKSQKLAVLSACFGSPAPIMIQDSAIIILFAGMLGAGSMLSLVTTALFGIMSCLFLIPFAYFVSRIGYKRSIVRTTIVGSTLMVMLALTPILGQTLARYGMIVCLICFGVSMTLYAAAWFPFIDEFLPENDRSRFFGMLRFAWQTCCVVFFFVCGLIIGKKPDLWQLQTIIVVAAFLLLGRAYFVNKIKVREADRKPLNFRYGLELVLANKPLVSFSVYLAFLYLAAQGTMPLTYIYLKNYLNIPDNIVVIISSLALGGTILGFLCAGRMLSRYGVKKMLLAVHIAFALVNFLLFIFCRPGAFFLAVITVLLVFYGFFIAISSVAASSEMMALANPNNKAMAMAFCVSMYSAGLGGARLLSSVIIGSGILSPEWTIGAAKFS